MEHTITEDSTTVTITVQITKKGGAELIDILQENIGYIEEELHEQIINGIQTWMNDNYNELLQFYINALQKGLVPASTLDDLIVENEKIRNINQELSEKVKQLLTPVMGDEPPIVETEIEDEGKEGSEQIVNKEENFKPLDKMNAWELKRLAKSFGLDVKGLSKNMILEMLSDEVSKRTVPIK